MSPAIKLEKKRERGRAREGERGTRKGKK